MNYYNPYLSMMPSSVMPASTGLLGGKIGWTGIINGIQKTLGIANQAIPLIRQVSPVVRNAKTMFKVMNEFKRVDTPVTKETTDVVVSPTTSQNHTTESASQSTSVTTGGPTFFL